MRAKLTKIHDRKFSRNGYTYFQRINFQLEDGSFAQTDLVSTFRNFGWWKPILDAGVGTWMGGVTMKNTGKVDADSRVFITQPILPQQSQSLFETTPSNEVRRFYVKSQSDPKKQYMIAIFPNGMMECDCPGFTFRKNCLHTVSLTVQLEKHAA